jgi:hypothetical protein
VDSELRTARRLAEERGVPQPHRRLSSPLTDATSDSVRRLPTNPGPGRRERLRWTRSVLGQLAYVDGCVASPIHPHVCRTPRISCEAVPPSIWPAGAQGGTSARSTGAALSFVSCIRLLGGRGSSPCECYADPSETGTKPRHWNRAVHRNEQHRRCVHQEVPPELHTHRVDQEHEREYDEQTNRSDSQGPRNQE